MAKMAWTNRGGSKIKPPEIPQQLNYPSEGPLDYEPPHEPDYVSNNCPETETHRYYGQKLPENHLLELENQINKMMPLNEISNHILALTYGEMIQLCEEILKVAGQKPLDSSNLPQVLHNWAIFKKTGQMPECSAVAVDNTEIKKESPRLTRQRVNNHDKE